MSTEIPMPGNTASTFLTHFFGSGLSDDRYVVERYKAHADGDIRPWPGEAPTKERRKAKRVTATLTEVRELRPARTEIIICTGLRTRGGIQVWVRWPWESSATVGRKARRRFPERPAGATPAGCPPFSVPTPTEMGWTPPTP